MAITGIHLAFGLLQMIDLLQTMKPEGDNLYLITGLDGHKNFFSAFLFTTACYLLIGALIWKGIWRMIAIGIVCVELPLVLILQTRSVFLAIIIFAIIFVSLLAFFHRKKMAPYLLKTFLLGLAVLAVVMAYGIYTDSLLTIVERLSWNNYLLSATGIERLSVWYKSSLLLQEHWLWGVGAKNWTLVYPKYGLSGMFRMQYLQTVFLQPHNDYLWVWCELGIAGLLSFVGLFMAAFFYLFQKIRQTTTQKEERISMMILTAWLAGFMVFSFFDFPKERMEQLVLLSVCFAFVSVKAAPVSIISISDRSKQLIAYLCLIIMVVAVVVVGARLRSEWLVRDMKVAEENKDITQYAELARTANTPLAPLDHISVPKFYHEGVAAYALGDYKKAYACFEKAYPLAPYNFNVLNNLGGMETYFGNHQKALEIYNEALRINPKNDDTRFNVSYTWYQLKQYDSALAILQPVWSNRARKAEFDSVILAAKAKSRVLAR